MASAEHESVLSFLSSFAVQVFAHLELAFAEEMKEVAAISCSRFSKA